MSNFADYSAVIVKSFPCKGLGANDYSAVIVKFQRHKEIRNIGPFFAGSPCVRALAPAHDQLRGGGIGCSMLAIATSGALSPGFGRSRVTWSRDGRLCPPRSATGRSASGLQGIRNSRYP
jgi:hypothetical protein